jgi:hypothetical protein
MLRYISIACVALFGAALFVGCDTEDKETPSQLGESCERTADCAKDLGCFNGVCRPADANVSVNAKLCKAIQCEAASDCCDPSIFQPAASCSAYAEYCAEDATSTYCDLATGPTCVCSESQYSCENNLCKKIECTAAADCCESFVPSTSCTDYAEYCALDATTYASYCTLATGPTCVCDASTKACTNNVCSSVASCTAETADTVCAYNQICSSTGVCAACDVDDDCSLSSQKCLNHACVTPECMTDVQCPAFSQCQSDNTCKEVGCATDRECMVYMDSYLATCDTSAKPVPTCSIACETDAQCATVSNPLRQCVSGRCTDPGCETDEECKIRLADTAAMNYSGVRAVCMEAAE